MWILEKLKEWEQNRLLKKQHELEKQKQNDEFKNFLLDLNFDFDVNDLLNYRDRCMLMGVEESIDDFIYISKDGLISSFFHIYVSGAMAKQLEILNISEGIEVLLSYLSDYDMNIPIVFPSTLKSLTTLYDKNIEDDNRNYNWHFNYNLINFDFSEKMECVKFNILDFSKCKNITHIGRRGLSNIKANKIILPDSLTHVDENAFESSEIKELVFNSKITFQRRSFFKSKIENLVLPGVNCLKYEAFDGAEGVKNLSEIFVYKYTYLERDSLHDEIRTLYLPLLKNNFKNGLSNYISYVESLYNKKYKEFTDEEWNSVMNLLGQYTSIDRKSLQTKNFILQGLNKEILRSDIDNLIEINGLLFNLGTFFYLEPNVDNDIQQDDVYLMLRYLANYWSSFLNSKEIEENNFNIYIYDGDKCDIPNDNYIRELDYKYVSKKKVPTKGMFSFYLESCLYDELQF